MTDRCTRARSDMTPCVVADGDLARADTGHCVGCGWKDPPELAMSAVSHDEMIAAVRAELHRRDKAESSECVVFRAVLSVLERHERAMAVVEAARDLIKRRSGALIAMNDAIAAFDAAGEAS